MFEFAANNSDIAKVLQIGYYYEGWPFYAVCVSTDWLLLWGATLLCCLCEYRLVTIMRGDPSMLFMWVQTGYSYEGQPFYAVCVSTDWLLLWGVTLLCCSCEYRLVTLMMDDPSMQFVWVQRGDPSMLFVWVQTGYYYEGWPFYAVRVSTDWLLLWGVTLLCCLCEYRLVTIMRGNPSMQFVWVQIGYSYEGWPFYAVCVSTDRLVLWGATLLCCSCEYRLVTLMRDDPSMLFVWVQTGYYYEGWPFYAVCVSTDWLLLWGVTLLCCSCEYRLVTLMRDDPSMQFVWVQRGDPSTLFVWVQTGYYYEGWPFYAVRVSTDWLLLWGVTLLCCLCEYRLVTIMRGNPSMQFVWVQTGYSYEGWPFYAVCVSTDRLVLWGATILCCSCEYRLVTIMRGDPSMQFVRVQTGYYYEGWPFYAVCVSTDWLLLWGVTLLCCLCEYRLVTIMRGDPSMLFVWIQIGYPYEGQPFYAVHVSADQLLLWGATFYAVCVSIDWLLLWGVTLLCSWCEYRLVTIMRGDLLCCLCEYRLVTLMRDDPSMLFAWVQTGYYYEGWPFYAVCVSTDWLLLWGATLLCCLCEYRLVTIMRGDPSMLFVWVQTGYYYEGWPFYAVRVNTDWLLLWGMTLLCSSCEYRLVTIMRGDPSMQFMWVQTGYSYEGWLSYALCVSTDWLLLWGVTLLCSSCEYRLVKIKIKKMAAYCTSNHHKKNVDKM